MQRPQQFKSVPQGLARIIFLVNDEGFFKKNRELLLLVPLETISEKRAEL
jgi:hypothetical protein